MAIILQCPRCTKEQKVDDDKAGREVPCRVCYYMIKAPGAAPKGKPVARKEEPTLGGIKAGAPGVPPVLAEKKPRPQKDDEPRKGTKRRDREEDEEERRPLRRRREEESSSVVMWLCLAGGGLLLVTLVCGGGLAIFRVASRDPMRDEPVVFVDQPPLQPIPFPQPAMPPQLQPPQIQPMPFPQPMQPPAFQPQEMLDPNNPKQIDRALAILRGPAQLRRPAFDWLKSANPDHARRAEVAKLLDGMVAEYQAQPFSNQDFFPAYFRWATNDNAASLMRLAENNAFTVWDNERRQKAMVTLGKLKEARAADLIATRLPNAFDGNAANEALREMGPAAEKAVLKYFNHGAFPGSARDSARKLLQGYGTKPEVLLTQCVSDLEDADKNVRNAALQCIAKTPVIEPKKAEVAKGLNKAIEDENSFRNRDLIAALENWGTNDNVPRLIEVLDSMRFRSEGVIRLLAKTRDPDALKAIAKRLNVLADRTEAQKVLRDCGAAAEPAVIDAMKTTTDVFARAECVRILGDIGTKEKSVPALFALAMQFPQDPSLRGAVPAALKKINSRP